MPEILTFNGKKYRYIRSKTKHHGYHIAAVNGKKGTIAISKTSKGRTELDTLIHEMLHACADFGNEEWVRTTATEIAKALWQLGYRKNAEQKNQKTNKQRDI